MSDLHNNIVFLNTINIILVIVTFSIRKYVNSCCASFAKNVLFNRMGDQFDLSAKFAKDYYSFELLKNRLSYCLGMVVSGVEKLVWLTSVSTICFLWYRAYEYALVSDHVTVSYACTILLILTVIFTTIFKGLVFLFCSRTHNEVSLYRRGKLYV